LTRDWSFGVVRGAEGLAPEILTIVKHGPLKN
jgi:hypothetical protein